MATAAPQNAVRARVVIVGGGFAGVQVAVELARDDRFRVTLISDQGHFRYLPALYKAAKGGRRTGASLRLSDILGDTGAEVVRAVATRVDRDARRLVTADGRAYRYDFLVLALGSVTDYRGSDALRTLTHTVKTNEEATRLKRHLHDRLLAGEDPLRITVVGGGGTGVEVVGALPAYLAGVATAHGLAGVRVDLTVTDPSPTLLHNRSPAMARAVTRRLRRLGVRVLLGERLRGDSPSDLRVGDFSLAGHTVVWAGGVTNPPFFAANGFPLTPGGKTPVDEFLRAEPDIYVIGDNAGTRLSGRAQTALHHGTFVAADLRRRVAGAARRPYRPLRPVLPTSLVPVGPKWVAVEWGPLTVSGRPGAALRLLVDLAAFKDVEAWPKAGERWLEIGEPTGTAESCLFCSSLAG